MKKRVLIVENAEKALKSMLSMLDANMIDNDLESSATEGIEYNGVKYPVKLVWLKRGDNDLVGCPCFACKFHGVLPSGERVDAIVYVKTFATRALTMCKMHMLTEETETKYHEIEDGETFVMEGRSKGYAEETYQYKNGVISRI